MCPVSVLRIVKTKEEPAAYSNYFPVSQNLEKSSLTFQKRALRAKRLKSPLQMAILVLKSPSKIGK